MRRLRRLSVERDRLLEQWTKASPAAKQQLVLQWLRLKEEIEAARERR